MKHEKKSPLISVVMPAYNAERFLEEAVRSVMDQTFQDWELLILEDCATDGTYALAERLAAEDDRITLLKNEWNMGVAKTRNRGFDLCRGKYVALLDSDDVWHPEKLAMQISLAEKTGADIIYCSYGIMNEQGKKKCDDFIVPERTSFESSLIKSVISCSTALLSREIVQKYRFREEYYHEDLVLWLEILRDGYQARGVTEVLAQYRILDSARSSDKIQCAIQRWPVYRRFLGYSPLKSIGLLIRYGLLGVIKYQPRTDTGKSE